MHRRPDLADEHALSRAGATMLPRPATAGASVGMTHHYRVKINRTVPLMLAVLATISTGCARPAAISSPPSIHPVSSVPPSCDATRAGVQWSAIVHESVLEHVFLFTADTPGQGTEVLNAPVTAAITGVTTPDTWLRLLATDLGGDIGVRVHTTDPSSSYPMGVGSWGETDPGISESIVYQGVRRVTAVFTVECAPAVSGALTAWTETKAGALMCGALAPPPDPYVQAARQYCPRTSGAPRSASPAR
jgi:hypothetical protein